MSDQEHLEQLRQGIEAGFDDIFRTYYPNLVGFADSMLRDRAAAEDVAQEVMLELWRRRSNIVLETSLRAYLFQATRNRALNLLRHQRVAARLDPMAVTPGSAPSADRELLEQEIAVTVRQAMTELPPRCREIFELSRIHGLRYAEIAQSLQISIKTVEAQMGKALRTIRERLGAWLPEAGGL